MKSLRLTAAAALSALLVAACSSIGGTDSISLTEVAPVPATAPADTEAPPTAPDRRSAADALKADARVAAAFAHIEANRERDNTWLVELTETPAPPFGEEVRAADFLARLQALGISDVRLDGVGNVVARRPGTKGEKTVAFVAHLDTVFPPGTDVTVRRDGDTFHAPGVGDNSRGLVVLLALADALNTHGIETEQDILLIGSVGEEGLGNLRGVRHLFAAKEDPIDTFIAVDGGAIDRLVFSGVGSNRYRVTFKGPGGHSYGAFGRAHPHQALARAITLFTEKAEPITKEPGTKATFSVGRIGGGTSINSIPFESWMEVDMRSVDPRKLDTLDAAFRAAVEEALAVENARRQSDEAMTVEVDQVGQRPAGRGDSTLPLIRNAVGALEAFGVQPRLAASSTDANIPIWLGVPAVTISRGGVSKNSHAPEESWEDVDAHKAIN